MQLASTLPESPSTLNGPSGLLIGERSFSHLTKPTSNRQVVYRDGSTTAPIKTPSNIRRLTSSTVIGSKSSSKTFVPSTLSGPPDLLIGEGNSENTSSTVKFLKQPENITLAQDKRLLLRCKPNLTLRGQNQNATQIQYKWFKDGKQITYNSKIVICILNLKQK